MSDTGVSFLPNTEYLNLQAIAGSSTGSAISREHKDIYHENSEAPLVSRRQLSRRILLPHESEWIDRANRSYTSSKNPRHISELLIPFSEEPNKYFRDPSVIESEYTNLRIGEVASYLGALVVDYPALSEERVTLGSRVAVFEDGERMIVDIVGFNKLYKSSITNENNEEVLPISVDSPLAEAIVGESIGSTKSLGSGINVRIIDIDQASVRRNWFENIVSLRLID